MHRLHRVGQQQYGSAYTMRVLVIAHSACQLSVYLLVQALHPAEHAELQAKCEDSQRRGTIEANLDQLKQVRNSILAVNAQIDYVLDDCCQL